MINTRLLGCLVASMCHMIGKFLFFPVHTLDFFNTVQC